jgi:hypothetical protein
MGIDHVDSYKFSSISLTRLPLYRLCYPSAEVDFSRPLELILKKCLLMRFLGPYQETRKGSVGAIDGFSSWPVPAWSPELYI